MTTAETYEIERELNQDLPRKLIWGSSLLFPAIFILMCVILALLFVSDIAGQCILLNQGVTTEGRVTSKQERIQKSAKVYDITFEFTVNGAMFTDQQRIPYESYQHAQNSVEVLYVPWNPAHHHAGKLTSEQVRNTALIYAAALFFLFWFFWALWYLSWQDNKNWIWLLRYGSAAPATILTVYEAKLTERTTSVTYSFVSPAGTMETSTRIFTTKADPWKVGTILTVLYDPDKPSQHELYIKMRTAGIATKQNRAKN